MDLSTSYLGLRLPNPLVVGASPLCDDLDAVRRLEDAGAAALVMHSLFEEQIQREHERNATDLEAHVNAFAEASSFLPQPSEFHLGPVEYLEQIDPGLTTWYKAGAVPPVQEAQGLDGVMLDATQMTAQNVAEFHAAGLTVIRQRSGESPAKWQAFLATGADGLMSDHEATIIKWCRQLG